MINVGKSCILLGKLHEFIFCLEGESKMTKSEWQSLLVHKLKFWFNVCNTK